MTVWFTSDTHFGHANVIKYSNRPFYTPYDMDEAIIKAWNERVKPGDLVYHLGDFALSKPSHARSIARRLNGQKYLIWGNHDKALRKDKEFLSQWIWTDSLKSVTVGGQKIVLCHYALLTWSQQHHGSWHLHGHSHGTLQPDPYARRVDIGVDCWNYAPVSFEQIAEVMKTKTFRAVDHHREAHKEEV